MHWSSLKWEQLEKGSFFIKEDILHLILDGLLLSFSSPQMKVLTHTHTERTLLLCTLGAYGHV